MLARRSLVVATRRWYGLASQPWPRSCRFVSFGTMATACATSVMAGYGYHTSCDGGEEVKKQEVALDDHSVMLRMARRGEVQQALRLFGRLGYKKETIITPRGETLLALACKEGQIELVEQLLALGANPKASDAEGSCCLSLACAHGQEYALQRLLKDMRRVDLEQRDDRGLAPLHTAITEVQPKCLDALLRHHCSPELEAPTPMSVLKPERERPLHMLLRPRDFQHSDMLKVREEMLEMLLVYGADVTAADSEGDTPLHITVRNGDLGAFWHLFGYVESREIAIALMNNVGVSVLDEANNWGVDMVIVVQLARYFRPGFKQLENWWYALPDFRILS